MRLCDVGYGMRAWRKGYERWEKRTGNGSLSFEKVASVFSGR